MAHEVEMINGVAQLAYAGQKPWHGLGVEVRNDLTPAQMMEKAGLDWTVHEVPSFVEFNGQQIPTGQKSLIRSLDNKILTNVGYIHRSEQDEHAEDDMTQKMSVDREEIHILVESIHACCNACCNVGGIDDTYSLFKL